LTSSDTGPVRAGEEIDFDRLQAYLLAHAAELDAGPRGLWPDIEQFAGGHSNLTYLISFGSKSFVLRRAPIGPVAPTAHDMPREFRLLQAIHPHFNLAPRPVLLCTDATIIGVPFYLMERRSGMIVRERIPREIGDDLALRHRVSESVVDTLAALHDVDIHETGIAQIGKPAGFVARQAKGWSDRWRRSMTAEVPEMDQMVQWLSERLPADGADAATIVHNDFKLDNIMLDVNSPERVVAVLDWEMCSVGDPLIDLGLLLCYWTLQSAARQGSLRAVTTAPGWFTREELIERYAMRTGRDLSGIVFYEAFARFKVAVIIQQIYYRFARGQTSDERFRHFDQLVLELARDGLAAVHNRKQ
jgi:aminoglycoside phosphotransferase (APT) family kinase protein